MKLNHLDKIIGLRKSKVSIEKKTIVSNAIEKNGKHGIHFLPCSYTKDVIDLSL